MSYYNLISIMPKASAAPVVPTVSDPNAQAFLNAAVITSTTQANAINDLVIGLKADGLWAGMNAIYPFVGGTASTHKYNLKDPRDLNAAYRLQFNGGITHSNNGALPNGTNGYADTFFNPSILSNGSTHFSAYLRTQLAPSSDIGCAVLDNPEDQTFISGNYFNFANSIFLNYSNGASQDSVLVANPSGNYIVTRTDLLNNQIYRNGTLLESVSMAGLNSNVNIFLMGNNTVYTGGDIFITSGRNQMAFATIGAGLTNTQSVNLYNRIQTFQTALSRQV